ncbi:flagellin N-terminal helical domain-containing protein [Aureimonas pseudogalii]|uniref:Flagellin n=1 Tax=Aureimonas pseudogalii TaxID=1744844 RepID=A0A7W6EAE2_9HYPH|nr:flagellin [Aureimonas pseudogalii]MBB3996401.1 flagellin [Aureimonas pseudogalii]
MASVNTNAAAITALRTLQQTNTALDQTQARISTGLRIGEAKDNAAYWAISVTLKSDNKSLATVKDALGLGTATVDVAYQGLNKTKDVLDEIKAKLTAATQPGVDRDVIQSEIAELQKQLVSIAGSSVFSGENWLSVDSNATDYNGTKKIVASFSRDGNNAVAIGTVDVSIGNLALFDSSTVAGKDAILDSHASLKDATGRDIAYGGTSTASGNTLTGGLPATAATVAGSAGTLVSSNAAQAAVTTTNVDLSKIADGDKLTIRYEVQGTSYTRTMTRVAGGTPSVNEFKDMPTLAAALDNANPAVAVSDSGATLIFTSAVTGSSTTPSTVRIMAVSLATSSGAAKTTVGLFAGSGTAAAGADFVTSEPAEITVASGAFQPLVLDKDDTIVFDLQINDETGAKTVRIDQALVNKTLSTPTTPVTNGSIATINDYQKVLAAAVKAANITNADVKMVGPNLVISTSNVAGAKAALAISNMSASGGGRQVSVIDIDISTSAMTASGADTGDKILTVLKAYTAIVNAAINKVTTAASNLGAVAARIDMQKSFVNTLMDTIEKGVGGLIDADMSEESTKLQALQVKQQLGVQALSIANQSSQNILQLFQQ